MRCRFRVKGNKFICGMLNLKWSWTIQISCETVWKDGKMGLDLKKGFENAISNFPEVHFNH